MYNWIWKGKLIIPNMKRGATADMIKHDVTMGDVLQALENGTKVVKRSKGIEERWMLQGRTIVIVVIEDNGEYWGIRPISRVTASKHKVRLILNKKTKYNFTEEDKGGEHDEMWYLR